MSNDITPSNAQFLPPESQELQTELDTVKKNQQTMIDQAIDSLGELAMLATQSQHPRAYDVLQLFLKTMSDMNKDMIHIIEKKHEAGKVPGETDDEGTVINNTLNFNGSMGELVEMLKQAKKQT
jgi:hypothetical protein